MIFAIDGYEANEVHRVGVGEYAYQILLSLQKHTAHRVNTTVRVYLPSSPREDMPQATDSWQYCIRKPKRFWTFGALPFGILMDEPAADVVFSPTHYVPRFIRTARVMSIMDLSFLSFPSLFRAKDYYQLVHWTEYAVRHSRAICTISEFSRDAIIKAYGVSPERVVVTYPSIPAKKSMTTSIDIQKKYNLSGRFVLAVGTIQPRKNYEKLIEAFSHIAKKEEFSDVELVIVGKKGWLFESILAAPKKFSIQGRVKFLDFVPDEDLSSLYRQAECFTLVSLYEGFGFPVLEAMAHDCQVVVSDSSSLPEVAGEAGIYVDPELVESIALGLKTALNEKGTEKAKKRIAAGKKRMKLFSWEKTAEKTLDILEKVGNGQL